MFCVNFKLKAKHVTLNCACMQKNVNARSNRMISAAVTGIITVYTTNATRLEQLQIYSHRSVEQLSNAQHRNWQKVTDQLNLSDWLDKFAQQKSREDPL